MGRSRWTPPKAKGGSPREVGARMSRTGGAKCLRKPGRGATVPLHLVNDTSVVIHMLSPTRSRPGSHAGNRARSTAGSTGPGDNQPASPDYAARLSARCRRASRPVMTTRFRLTTGREPGHALPVLPPIVPGSSTAGRPTTARHPPSPPVPDAGDDSPRSRRLLTVVKRSGATEPFSRDKVLAGVRKACQGRPVTEDDLALLAQRVEE